MSLSPVSLKECIEDGTKYKIAPVKYVPKDAENVFHVWLGNIVDAIILCETKVKSKNEDRADW